MKLIDIANFIWFNAEKKDERHKCLLTKKKANIDVIMLDKRH